MIQHRSVLPTDWLPLYRRDSASPRLLAMLTQPMVGNLVCTSVGTNQAPTVASIHRLQSDPTCYAVCDPMAFHS